MVTFQTGLFKYIYYCLSGSQGAQIGSTWKLREAMIWVKGDSAAGLISLVNSQNYQEFYKIVCYFYILHFSLIYQVSSSGLLYNKRFMISKWGNEYAVTWKFFWFLSKGSQNISKLLSHLSSTFREVNTSACIQSSSNLFISLLKSIQTKHKAVMVFYGL